MKYEQPDLEVIFSEDVVVTSFLIDEGTGSGMKDDEEIIF